MVSLKTMQPLDVIQGMMNAGESNGVVANLFGTINGMCKHYERDEHVRWRSLSERTDELFL